MNSFRDAAAGLETAVRDANDPDFLANAAKVFIALVNIVHSRTMTPAQLVSNIEAELEILSGVVSVVEVVDPEPIEGTPDSGDSKSDVGDVPVVGTTELPVEHEPVRDPDPDVDQKKVDDVDAEALKVPKPKHKRG